jgi:hypothetical protein
MNVNQRECLLLLIVFIGVVVFVWKFIVADLPDDFLIKLRTKRQVPKEGDDGRLRDHW